MRLWLSRYTFLDAMRLTDTPLSSSDDGLKTKPFIDDQWERSMRAEHLGCRAIKGAN